MLTGDSIVDAASGLDQQSGGPAVFVTLDGKGAKRFEDATRTTSASAWAWCSSNKTETKRVDGELKNRLHGRGSHQSRHHPRPAGPALPDHRAGQHPRSPRSGSAVAGRRAGQPDRDHRGAHRHPSAGKENIAQGFRAAMVSLLVIAAFMVGRYRWFGAIATAALAANVVLIVATLSMLQATLTLPGIAGIVC